jgi:prepilin-type N-terminal cleavage/methylation domain-containing protein
MIEPVLGDQGAREAEMEGRVMRAPHSKAAAGHTPAAGFSLIELLITIVVAGIVFSAMVPFFLNALSSTARDARRNDAQLIAQDRIEQVRLLNYADISQDNLNSPPSPAADFGDGRFGTLYTLTGQRPYAVQYVVVPQVNAEKVRVSVTPADHGFTTTMETITVAFKNWADVIQSSSKGVYWTRVDTAGNPVNSTHIWPTSTNQTVSFTGLTGGSSYTYTVTCYSSKWQSGSTPFTSPPFHLLKSARLKFDTNPGGS